MIVYRSSMTVIVVNGVGSYGLDGEDGCEEYNKGVLISPCGFSKDL